MQAIQVENKSGAQEKKSVRLMAKGYSLAVVDLQTEQQIYEFKSLDVDFELGGNNQKLLFIKPKTKKEVSYYLEPTKADWNELLKIEGFAEALKHLRKQDHKNRLAFWVVPLMILGLIVAAFVFRGPIAGSVSTAITFSTEKKLGDKIFTAKRTEEQKKVEENLKQLISVLTVNDPRWKDQFTFHISSNTESNAYATIGGHIFINKGLITAVEKPEDLLGVVSHEMIHVQQRHVVKSLVQGLGVFSILSLMFGDVTGLAAVLVDQGAPLLNLSYSRELEDEADRLALQMMAKSGVDPEGLARSLEVIQKQYNKMMAENPAGEVLEKLQKIEILNSHPEIEKRISTLRQQAIEIRQQSPVKPIDFNFSQLQKDVKEYF